MKKNHLSPNAISHKDLNALLKKAHKEIPPIESPGNEDVIENQELNDLLKDWTKTSKKIIESLNKKDTVLTKNTNSKSLMALGAMGAHINMALQALKATGFDK